MMRLCMSLLFLLHGLDQFATVLIQEDCVCGVGNSEEINTRIINGLVAFPHQYPWIVYMKYYGKAYCGGAIINNLYILTAGHCIYKLDARFITVVVGGHDSEVEDGISIPAAAVKLHENYTRHPAYDDNDVALIKLSIPLDFNHNISPICLPNPSSTYTTAHVTIAGWGTTERGMKSRYLLHNVVTVLSQSSCQTSKKIGRKFVSQQNLCAYGFQTDTCQGDSGSPLVYETSPYKFEIVGVVSWGEGCAPKGIPSVYAKVSHYLKWIQTHTSDAKYCKVT